LIKERWAVVRERSLGHEVFVSHAKEDAGTAARVCAMLEATGIGCWLASRDAGGDGDVSLGLDLSASADRAAQVLEAIRASNLVLLVFSASANSSPTVLREIERAIAYEKPVLSLHLDDAVPNPSLEYYLNLWQWLDASAGLEEKRADIVAAVCSQLAQVSESTTWRWLDAPGGVEGKREEIVAAVRERLGQTPESDAIQGTPTGEGPEVTESAGRRGLSRRAWAMIAGAAILVFALSLGLGLGLGLQGADDQGTWIQVEVSGTPLIAHAAVYDPSSGRIIVFGHAELDTNDIWAYDLTANTCTELKPAGPAPVPHTGFAADYDPNTGRLILFGGWEAQPSSEDPDKVGAVNDTWAYDPAVNIWTELVPTGPAPTPRWAAAIAYDPATQRLILFGGWDSVACLDDTWAYDAVANTWTELQPSGPKPGERWGYAAAYDSSAGQMVLFGGESLTGQFSDTWAYDPVANTWTELKPTGKSPAPRTGAVMVYDPLSRRIIMFGGCRMGNTTYFNDTWVYDSAANVWTELDPAGASPSPRFFTPLVYVPSTNQIFMFGGSGPGGYVRDMWAFSP
jgi:N-acetylneuraminic acid mutarotase